MQIKRVKVHTRLGVIQEAGVDMWDREKEAERKTKLERVKERKNIERDSHIQKVETTTRM